MPEVMDKERTEMFKSRMNTIASGEAMLAAARDYGLELQAKEAKEAEARKYAKVDVDDLMDDPELVKLHELRLAQMKSENEKRQIMSHKGHGELTQISEIDFLEVVTKTERCVVHFFHKDFERCKIMDKHIKELTPEYFETRFVKISAPDSPFFVTKLQVQVLPCVIFFVQGVAVDRVVGFDELGGTDDFKTPALVQRMIACSVLKKKVKTLDDSDDEELEQVRNAVRKGGQVSYTPGEDEDSDFSD